MVMPQMRCLTQFTLQVTLIRLGRFETNLNVRMTPRTLDVPSDQAKSDSAAMKQIGSVIEQSFHDFAHHEREVQPC